MFSISIEKINTMYTELNNDKVLLQTKKLLDKYKICDRCLGRLYRNLGPRISNKEKGEYLRKKIKKEKTKTKNCYYCKGLLLEIEHFSNLIYNNLMKYEFETFLIGSKIDEEIVEIENCFTESFEFKDSESIKSEINRELGLILEPKLKKEVDFKNPNIMVIIDTQFDVIKLQIKPLYIYGRYKKFSRKIPQTKWYCKICKGRGCKKCNYEGKLYDKSVEELISKKFIEYTDAKDEAFHGAGREDIDVRMLGNGRPFILELKAPNKRNVNLDKIKDEINKTYNDFIEISNIRFSSKGEVARIKKTKFNKTYKVVFECGNAVNNEKLKKAVQSLQGTTIKQKTPLRVAHRRADMIREKHIYSCEIDSLECSIATLILETESGTYIKELISGDDGRTSPSMSGLLDAPCKIKELDVIKIKGE